jgi:RHS repeat-associated protein
VAGRTAPRGYAPTNERNRFTGHARDQDTGYDHTLWRKLDSVQGRWTSPDPYGGSMEIGNPQSFNRYAYVLNDPVNLMDPLGLDYAVEIRASDWGDYSALWSLWAGRRDMFAVALQPVGQGGGGGIQDIVDQSREDVREILKEKGPCSTIFGGSETALKAFNSINFRVGEIRDASGKKINYATGVSMILPGNHPKNGKY